MTEADAPTADHRLWVGPSREVVQGRRIQGVLPAAAVSAAVGDAADLAVPPTAPLESRIPQGQRRDDLEV